MRLTSTGLPWEEDRLTWNGTTFIRKLDVASLTETLQSPEGRTQTRTYGTLGRVRSSTIPGLEPVYGVNAVMSSSYALAVKPYTIA